MINYLKSFFNRPVKVLRTPIYDSEYEAQYMYTFNKSIKDVTGVFIYTPMLGICHPVYLTFVDNVRVTRLDKIGKVWEVTIEYKKKHFDKILSPQDEYFLIMGALND